MLSLISTLGGLLFSGLPKVLEFFQSKSDQKHELSVMSLQIERDIALAKEGFLASIKAEEVRTEQVAMSSQASMTVGAQNHDKELIGKASQWVINYMATVRPTVTYLFVIELIFVNVWVAVYGWTHYEMMASMDDFVKFTSLIFGEDEMAILGGIIGFWFGSRNWTKK